MTKTALELEQRMTWLTDVNVFCFFHEAITVDGTFHHFYLKSYRPQVTYWEQGHRVGLKRRRQVNLPCIIIIIIIINIIMHIFGSFL